MNNPIKWAWMPRPRAQELTERELAVMRVFWDEGPGTADDARERLEQSGAQLAYVTVANVVRGLPKKGSCDSRTRSVHTFTSRPAASRTCLDAWSATLIQKLDDSSREQLLVQILANAG